MCGRSSAGGGATPNPLLPYVERINVGHADCDTCLPYACPGEPVQVSVSGHLPPCVHFRGLHARRSFNALPVVVAEFTVDTCVVACPTVIMPFSGSTSLPPQPEGLQLVDIQVAVRACPDTSTVVDSSGVEVGYRVLSECPPGPIPPDSLVKTFVSLRIVPEHPCAGDTVSILLVENGCPPCVHLVSFDRVRGGTDTFAGVVDWTPVCAELRCASETLSVQMGQLPQGSFRFTARLTVRVLGTANPDSMIAFHVPFEFQVAPPCTNPPGPCVQREMFSDQPAGRCAVTLRPGQAGELPLYYSSDLAMGGLQGTIELPPPFRLAQLRLASGRAGVHLSWTRQERGARWLAFTDPGVTLEAGERQTLLYAVVAADPSATDGQSGLMFAHITVASSPAGDELPFCIRNTLDFQVIATQLCVAGEPTLCDINADGWLDVRDLVRMVTCLDSVAHNDRDQSPCRDCNADGTFDLGDIFCCAGHILRGPLVPRDSVRSDPMVSVTFAPTEVAGSDLVVRVHVLGAHALGAAQLRFDYPAYWRAHARATLGIGTRPEDVDWYPVGDFSQPGRIDLGALRIGDSGADELTFELAMTPPTVFPGRCCVPDRLKVVGADLAARDGSVVTPMGALPSIVIEPFGVPAVGELALSLARPNPFNGSTTFSVSLPTSAPVDLAVHDLAGRRVATLAHAVYDAGPHDFTWDGAGAHDGLYFVRLTVNGQVLSTRVAMLRGSR